MAKRSKTEQALEYIRATGVVRPRDLASHGITPEHLRRLRQKRLVEQPARGLYRAVGAEVTAYHSLATVAKRVPQGIICLLSALSFHEFTTQSPPEVWVGIRSGARIPALKQPMVRVVQYSATSLDVGCETHDIEGVSVRITNPAKTVADCFKYRNKVGLDVALESLRECRRLRLANSQPDCPVCQSQSCVKCHAALRGGDSMTPAGGPWRVASKPT